MRILITGGTGFVGRELVRRLSANSEIKLIIITRNADKARRKLGQEHEYIEWPEISKQPSLDNIRPLDGVINLIGAPVAEKRWNNLIKKELFNSRVDATEQIFRALEDAKIKPKFFISSSAVGYYGNTGNESVDESAPHGNGFLANLCKSWEQVVLSHQKSVERWAILRIGVVIGKGGGIVQKLLPLFKLGLGGRLGKGDQYLSWIHRHDLISVIEKIIFDNQLSGVFNLVSEFPVTNAEFTKSMGNLTNKPTVFNVPAVLMSTVLGEMSSVMLEGQRVVPQKLKDLRFHYRYPTLESALKEVISKERK